MSLPTTVVIGVDQLPHIRQEPRSQAQPRIQGFGKPSFNPWPEPKNCFTTVRSIPPCALAHHARCCAGPGAAAAARTSRPPAYPVLPAYGSEKVFGVLTNIAMNNFIQLYDATAVEVLLVFEGRKYR